MTPHWRKRKSHFFTWGLTIVLTFTTLVSSVRAVRSTPLAAPPSPSTAAQRRSGKFALCAPMKGQNIKTKSGVRCCQVPILHWVGRGVKVEMQLIPRRGMGPQSRPLEQLSLLPLWLRRIKVLNQKHHFSGRLLPPHLRRPNAAASLPVLSILDQPVHLAAAVAISR